MVNYRSGSRASALVAANFFGVEPRAVERTSQFVGEHVQVAGLLCDFALACLALDEVVKVIGAVLDDEFRQLVLIDLDGFHKLCPMSGLAPT